MTFRAGTRASVCRDSEIAKSDAQFPGWQHDLGLIGRYKQEIAQGFSNAEEKGTQIRKDAATGKMMVPNRVDCWT